MKPNSQLLFIVNPISGNSDKSQLIDLVCNEVEKRDYSMEVYKTTGNDDDKKIKELLNSIKPDRILVAGGDGTIKQVADILEDLKIPLGLFPAGSANGL
ncbi:MAG: acylglycerol kinase family protein, partial [Leeuwenhoekiella sp.]